MPTTGLSLKILRRRRSDYAGGLRLPSESASLGETLVLHVLDQSVDDDDENDEGAASRHAVAVGSRSGAGCHPTASITLVTVNLAARSDTVAHGTSLFCHRYS